MLHVRNKQQTLNCRGKLLDISSPSIMGIINVNTDSFYAGSRVQVDKDLIDLAETHLSAGASILDIGVMSSRPGAQEMDENDELDILINSIQCILSEFPESIISADTYRAKVAEAALESGAHIINDIGGGLFDEHIMSVVGRYGAPYVLMHNRAKSIDMMNHTEYDDLMLDVVRYFYHQSAKAVDQGISDIILDPGIGFSKTQSHNFELLNRMSELNVVERPLLVGLSRKSFIYKTLNIDPSEGLNGTTAMHMVALQAGASFLRVHDVKEAKQCIQLYNEMSRPRSSA